MDQVLGVIRVELRGVQVVGLVLFELRGVRGITMIIETNVIVQELACFCDRRSRDALYAQRPSSKVLPQETVSHDMPHSADTHGC